MAANQQILSLFYASIAICSFGACLYTLPLLSMYSLAFYNMLPHVCYEPTEKREEMNNLTYSGKTQYMRDVMFQNETEI